MATYFVQKPDRINNSPKRKNKKLESYTLSTAQLPEVSIGPINQTQRQQLHKLLLQYTDLFATDDNDFGRTNW
ncbi:9408_t:CDS:1, partial [Ambispora gerdemannii]